MHPAGRPPEHSWTRVPGQWLLALVLLGLVASKAVAQDVYILYSGSGKAEKSVLQKSLGKKLKVRTYNVALLALADYSGKQRTLAKLND